MQKKHMVRNVILMIVWAGLLYWFMLPPLNPLSGTFWKWLFWVSIPAVLVNLGGRNDFSGLSRLFQGKLRKQKQNLENELKQIKRPNFALLPLLIIVIGIVFSLLS